MNYKEKLTMMSPSCGICGSLALHSLLWWSVPSCRNTQLSASFPIGTVFMLHFLLPSPVPQTPVMIMIIMNVAALI